MKKFILLIALVLVASPAFCQVVEFLDINGVPRPVSEGWPMPTKIGSGTTITIGSATFSASPVFADSAGSATLALTDPFRRSMVNIASDAVGINASTASTTAKVETLRAQQATESALISAGISSTTAKVETLRAEQATSAALISASVSSTTLKVEELRAQSSTDSQEISDAVATASGNIETLRAQQATETLNILAALASSTLAATGSHAIDQSIPGVTNAVQDRVLLVASTTVSSFTTVAYTIPMVASAQEIFITLTGSNKQAWVVMGGDAPTVGNGMPFSSSFRAQRLNGSEIIKVIASETIGACWTQR